MKSKLLSILLVFVVSLARSQDWAPVKTGPKYLYGISTKLPSFGQIGLKGRLIIPVQLDTLSGSPSAGFGFGAKDTLYKDRSGKWIGGGLFSNSVTRLANGQFRISNGTFLPNVAEGGLVAQMQVGAATALTGYALHKRTGLVLGQPDSLINIRWVAATGFANHPLANDTSFILSKRFGLVRFRNFGDGTHFNSDPFSSLLGFNGPYQFSESVQLEGIPDLQLGVAEMDASQKPGKGDVRQVLTENDFDKVSYQPPCTRETGHTYQVYEEMCTDTATSQGNFYATWKWKKGACDSTFSSPAQVTDSGTVVKDMYPFEEVVAMLKGKIGYYPSQSVFQRSFCGQFKTETGVRFRFWVENGIDIPSSLKIMTNPWSDESGTFQAGSWLWWNSPCSTGAFQPYNTQVQYPSYLKTGNITEGNLLLISSVAGAKMRPSLHITPNPATTELYISSPEKVRRISMVNTLGKTVKETAPDGEGRIGLAGLPAGVYLVRWWGVNGEGGTERVVKE